MAVYGYSRVSTGQQGEEDRCGLPAQVSDIQACADRYALGSLTATFQEAGYGRESDPFSRPAMSALLSVSRSGDVVIFPKWDRVGGTVECGLVDRFLKKKGVRVLMADGTDTEGPHAELLRDVLGAVGSAERRAIAARVKGALAVAKSSGKKYCARVYGYTATEDGRFEPNHEELAVIDRIRRELELGYTLREVAESLTDDGIPSPQGKGPWAFSTVRRVAQRGTSTQVA